MNKAMVSGIIENIEGTDQMCAALQDMYKECSIENWDGQGAQAITNSAFKEAQMVIDALPSSIPTPVMVAEPTGDIGFEWYRGKGQVFVISVSGDRRITYAGLVVGNKVHGEEHFDSTLPMAVIQNIMRLYSL
ncbi:MAG: hypothetical protein L7F77_05685 [Candidatus Magnetominusculus sp. LBB02]|nr:hypothetical protein [Candidatus Magnetominusculus sp. LBB02]